MTFGQIEAQALQDVATVGSALIVTGITYLTTKIVPHYIKSKTAQQAIDSLGQIAVFVVQDFNQRIVSEAKANGVWTASLAASVKADAVKAVMSQAGNLVKLANKTLGNVESLVSGLIESAVVNQKTVVAQSAKEATANA